MNQQVILLPKGSLDAKAKERLTKASVVYIEVEDPSKVVLLAPASNLITGDQILRSAFDALDESTYVAQAAFFRSLKKSITSKEARP